MQQAQPGQVRTPLQGILQLGQVSVQPRLRVWAGLCSGTVGLGQGSGPNFSSFLQSGPDGGSCAGPVAAGPGAGQSTHPQGPAAPASPRLPVGWLGVKGTPSDRWMLSSLRS